MEEDKIDLRRRDTTGKRGQINFRVDPRHADKFRAFCVEQNIKQADGFRMLVQLLEEKETAGQLPESLEVQKDLQARVDQLKTALHKVTQTKKAQAKRLKQAGRAREIEKRAKIGVACCKTFSEVLCKRFLREEWDDCYEMQNWAEAQRSGVCQYSYPETGAIKVLRVEVFYFENTQSGGSVVGCFTANDGEKIKLRIWPRDGFTPLCSTQAFYKNKYMSMGRRWLCAYEKMKHGYIELICAIPAPDCFEIPWEYEIGEDGPYAREIQKRIWLKEIEDEVEWNRKIQEEAEQEELNSFDDLPHDEEKHPALADIMSWAERISKEKR